MTGTKETRENVGDRRLLRLAKFLRTLPRERFYFGTWVGSDWKGDQGLSCGTTACALGWAATMPFFRRLGLRLGGGGVGGYIIMGEDHNRDDGLEIASTLFGISLNEAGFLFLPNGDLIREGRLLRGPSAQASAKEVAKHIERFVKRRERARARA